jgi:hypothetical protein
MTNLNPTFRKDLKDKKIIVDFKETFVLTPYELNQIRFWINKKHQGFYLPTILPVSKRFCLDFIGWDNSQFNDVLLVKFHKVFFSI